MRPSIAELVHWPLFPKAPVRQGAEPGFFFENCLRTMLRKASTAGLSSLGLNPMSIDVQWRERIFLDDSRHCEICDTGRS
jgi:hypothetical protein